MQTRPAIILLSDFTLRFIGRWIGVLRQLSSEEADLETWLIVVSVTVVGARKFLRESLDEDLQDLSVAMPAGQLDKCNLSSISAATGLNRETVRRKVNWLIAAGILEKEGTRDVRASPVVTSRPEVHRLVLDQVKAVRRLNEQLTAISQSTGPSAPVGQAPDFEAQGADALKSTRQTSDRSS